MQEFIVSNKIGFISISGNFSSFVKFDIDLIGSKTYLVIGTCRFA